MTDHHLFCHTLAQLNIRLPAAERARLKQLAQAEGVSLNALLGAILGSFLSDHTHQIPSQLLTEARAIDSTRRERPHLRRPPVPGD